MCVHGFSSALVLLSGGNRLDVSFFFLLLLTRYVVHNIISPVQPQRNDRDVVKDDAQPGDYIFTIIL